MRRSFLAGLTLLLPFVLTLVILRFVMNIITAPFLGLATSIVDGIVPRSITSIFLTHETLVHFLSQIFILAALTGIILGIGLIGRYFLFEYLVEHWEGLMQRVPIIRQIYKWTKDVAQLVFNSEKQKFSQVVLLPFPHKGAFSLGFITADEDKERISVFVPGTPNPTVGYMLTCPQKDLIYLDIKVDEALKIVVSGQFPTRV